MGFLSRVESDDLYHAHPGQATEVNGEVILGEGLKRLDLRRYAGYDRYAEYEGSAEATDVCLLL
jgi:hypothetical protein